MIIKLFIPIPGLDLATRLYDNWYRSLGEVSYRRVLKGVVVGCWIVILAFLLTVAYYAAVEPNIRATI